MTQQLHPVQLLGKFVQHNESGSMGFVSKHYPPGEYPPDPSNQEKVSDHVIELDNGNAFLLYRKDNPSAMTVEVLSEAQARFYLQCRSILNHSALELGKLAVAMKLPQDNALQTIRNALTHTIKVVS
jgi:hypothetical protein